MVMLLGGTTSFFILIATVGLFRSCMGYNEIDIDNDIMTQRYEVARHYVTDSTRNGFELLWFTTKAVSKKRYEEIRTRKHIFDSYTNLKIEAGDHFKHNLINTDIYDFAEWAKTYDIDPDVRLVNIWVYGAKYEKLYRQPHPDFPEVHTPWAEQIGILFLKEDDVYRYNPEALRTYRYWNCEATSLSDERYNHVTERDYKRHKKM